MSTQDATLQLVVGLVDKASKPLSDMLGNLGKQVAGLTAGYLTLNKIFHSMTESEDIANKLAKTIATVGGATGITVDQVNKLALALQNSSKYSEGAAKQAADKLITFGAVTREDLKQTLDIVANLASKMQWDLPQAAQMYSRAMLAPLAAQRMLRQSGIQLSESVQSQIKAFEASGQHTKAQALLTAEFVKQVGSGPPKIATMSAALAQLANVATSLVEGGAGGLKGATKAVQELSAVLGDEKVKKSADDLFSLIISMATSALQKITELVSGVTALGRVLDLTAKSVMPEGSGRLLDWLKKLSENLDPIQLFAKEVNKLADAMERFANQTPDERRLDALKATLPRDKDQQYGKSIAGFDTKAERAAIAKKEAEIASLTKSTTATRERNKAAGVVSDLVTSTLRGDQPGVPGNTGQGNAGGPTIEMKAIAQYGAALEKLNVKFAMDALAIKEMVDNQGLDAGVAATLSKGLAAQRAADYKAMMDSMQEVDLNTIEAMKLEGASYWNALREQTKTATQQAEDALQKSNSDITDMREKNAISAESADARRAEAGKQYAASMSGIVDAETQLTVTHSEYMKSLDMSADHVAQLGAYADQAMRGIQGSFKTLIVDSFNGGLKDLGLNILNTFRDIFADIAAQKLASGIIGKVNDSTGNLSGGLLSGFINGIIGSVLPADTSGIQPYQITGAAKRAGGGTASGTTLVGENGPELVTSGINSMKVYNQRQMAFNGGGSAQVKVAPVYNIDARGATMDLMRVLPGLLEETTRKSVEMSRAAVRNDLSRRAMGGRG